MHRFLLESQESDKELFTENTITVTVRMAMVLKLWLSLRCFIYRYNITIGDHSGVVRVHWTTFTDGAQKRSLGKAHCL